MIIRITINVLLHGNSIEGTVSILHKKNCRYRSKSIVYCADNIYISCLIYTTRVFHVLLRKANHKLLPVCKENELFFVDNDTIGKNYLYNDGMHLLNSEKQILADNFLILLKNDLF